MAEEGLVRELAALVAELRVVAERLCDGATALAGGAGRRPVGVSTDGADGADGAPEERARDPRRGGEGVLA
ncbi:MAG: hypothetical protein ACYTKD_18665 [Planctomycetota bacterium]